MTTSMTIRMDPEIKKQSQELFHSLGLDMTTATNLFLRQSLMHRGLPFAVQQPLRMPLSLETLSAAELDQELQKGYDDITAGRTKPVNQAFAEIRRDYGA